MKNNSHTNSIIQYVIIVVDFVLLNILLYLLTKYHPWFELWIPSKIRTLILLNNIGLLLSEYFNLPVIHRRVISVGDILKRVLRFVLVQSFFAFFFMKILSLNFVGGRFQASFCLLFLVVMLITRVVERSVIKHYRRMGGNRRTVMLVGSDSELLNICHHLLDDASRGYHIIGYYADKDIEDVPENIELARIGTLQGVMDGLQGTNVLPNVDEIYVSISRKEREFIRKISNYCDRNMIRFYYVPVSLETLGISLKREQLDDMEIFTTYENPLQNPVNKLIKRVFDIVFSSLFLLCSLPLFPIIWIIIKTQSPGPLFFKQLRTGLDGKEFPMYKFRSMHVNKDADKLQATENDPRKYPFGNFMRKANIDEIPQFWNVLIGDMSIVGPRPHMLAHTEMYSQLINKYMVRHFVKPGVTGWAQVTGFRGETKELWQMEGRVKRDIWYMENWSVWLDIRIMWMTAKTIFIHDKKAY